MSSGRQLDAQNKAFVDLLVRAAVAVLLVGNAVVGYADSDIWGHMAIGVDTLRLGHLLRVDPYSFTHDVAWVNHEWLWEVTTAWLFQHGGLPALLVTRAVLVATVLWLVDRATRFVPGPVRLMTLCLVALACVGQWRSTRPQLASLAAYAVLLSSLDARWLPAMFAVWANVHGGWLIGIAAMGLRALVTASRRAIVLAIACAAATLLNPYGLRLWTATIGGLLRDPTDVTEWRPIWSLPVEPGMVAIWLLMLAVLLLVWRRTRSTPWGYTWTCATMLAAANTRRLIAFAAITIAMTVMSRYEPVPESPGIVWTSARRLAAAVTLAIALIVAAVQVAPSLTCFAPLPGWNAPEPGAVAFLRSSTAKRAIVHFDFGEYAIFHLRDRLRVSVDNRHYTVYSDAALKAGDRFVSGQDPEYPERIGADAIWLLRSNVVPLAQMETRGWHRRFDGPRTVILLRDDGPLVHGEWSGDTPCFPNP
ncbi:MAG: hypothetical protein U0Q11_09250 [Vicinamibacterales bacterium]